MLIPPYVWLRSPWTSRVKQMVSAWRLVVPLSLVVFLGVDLHHLYNEAEDKIHSRGFQEFIWGFLLLTTELTTCEFTLKPVTALSEDQLRSWVPVVLVPPPLQGALGLHTVTQPTPLRTQSPRGNTHPSGFLPHLLFGTKYTPLKVFLKTVLQQK